MRPFWAIVLIGVVATTAALVGIVQGSLEPRELAAIQSICERTPSIAASVDYNCSALTGEQVCSDSNPVFAPWVECAAGGAPFRRIISLVLRGAYNNVSASFLDTLSTTFPYLISLSVTGQRSWFQEPLAGINLNAHPSIGNMTLLRSLVLSQCTLSGDIPAWIGKLTQLEYLAISNLDGATLGTLPDAFANLKQVTRLEIVHTHLTGSLPPSIGGMSSLGQLILTNNTRLRGTWSASYEGLRRLTGLSAVGTTVCGTWPFAPTMDTQLFCNFDAVRKTSPIVCCNSLSGPKDTGVCLGEAWPCVKCTSPDQYKSLCPYSLTTGLPQGEGEEEEVNGASVRLSMVFGLLLLLIVSTLVQ